MSSGHTLPDGPLAAAISDTVVRALAETTGRGPTKAKTTLGENGVFVVLQDSLTRGERTLTDAGEGEAVLGRCPGGEAVGQRVAARFSKGS